MTSELVERAQRGDRDAFEHLVRPAWRRLFGVAYGIVRDAPLAEDAVQDAIVRCWRDLRGLRNPARFDAWLYRLTVNACRDQVRRSRRRPIEIHALPLERATDRMELARLEDRDELERGFSRLTLDHRAALVLTHYVGMSTAEVASILRVPEGTVHSRVHYALRAMRGLIADDRAGSQTAEESGRRTDAAVEQVR